MISQLDRRNFYSVLKSDLKGNLSVRPSEPHICMLNSRSIRVQTKQHQRFNHLHIELRESGHCAQGSSTRQNAELLLLKDNWNQPSISPSAQNVIVRITLKHFLIIKTYCEDYADSQNGIFP